MPAGPPFLDRLADRLLRVKRRWGLRFALLVPLALALGVGGAVAAKDTPLVPMPDLATLPQPDPSAVYDDADLAKLSARIDALVGSVNALTQGVVSLGGILRDVLAALDALDLLGTIKILLIVAIVLLALNLAASLVMRFVGSSVAWGLLRRDAAGQTHMLSKTMARPEEICAPVSRAAVAAELLDAPWM